MQIMWCLLVRETSSQVASLWFRVVLAGALSLTVLAVHTGTDDYRLRREQYDQLLQQRETDRARNEGRLSGRQTELGLRVLRPPALGSALVHGLEGVMPAYWDFSPAGLLQGPKGPALAQDSEIGAVFDLEALVRIVLGLLAMVLGLQTVGGERASGTLASLLTQPVHRLTIAIGKFSGTALTLGLALAIVSATALLILWFQLPDLARAEAIPVLLWLEFAAFAYLVFMLALGMAIGSVVRSFPSALIAGIGAWAYIVFFGPQLIIFGARALEPVPPVQRVEVERQKVFDARSLDTDRLIGRSFSELEMSRATAALNFVPQPATRSEIARLWTTAANETRRILNAFDERVTRSSAQQDRVLSLLAVTNPATVLLNSAMNLADSGRLTRQRWVEAVHSYQDVLNQRLFDDPPRLILSVPADLGEARVGFNQHRALTTAEVGTFVTPTLPLLERVRESAFDLLLLAGYAIVAIVAALLLFPKSALA